LSPSITRWFYVALALVLSALVVAGFWTTYFGPLLSGRAAPPVFIHLHAAVFSGWMVLLLAQAWLAATRRLRLHRRLGAYGVAYAVLVFVLGLVATFAAPALHVRSGAWSPDGAAAFLLLPLVDMAMFAGFFGAAVAYRNRPEIHKRLILAATVVLAFPAIARLPLHFEAAYLLVWLSPLFAAMLFDARTRGQVHPVHILSVAIMTTAFLRLFIMDSEAWLQIGRALLFPLT
jgi:hypothetical protein